MYRSHTCGELRIADTNKEVTLSGWISKLRDKGFVVWIDLRDRYGITQLVFDEERSPGEIPSQPTVNAGPDAKAQQRPYRPTCSNCEPSIHA